MENVEPEIRILTPILLSQFVRNAFTVCCDTLQHPDKLQRQDLFYSLRLLEPTRTRMARPNAD